MIGVSYICEEIFVVMGKFKFPKSSQFVFLIRVLSFIVVYFANPCLLFYV